MHARPLVALVAVMPLIVLALGISPPPAAAQTDPPSVSLVVDAGRPLRLALDDNFRVKGVGQSVTATLVEPVYAYDRIVLPVGTKAIGRIEQIDGPRKWTRVRVALGGDLSPARRVRLRFDSLVLDGGQTLPIQTAVTDGIEHVRLTVAGGSESKASATNTKPGAVAQVGQRAAEEVAREAKEAASLVTAPGKMERLKWAAIGMLPYRPQILRKGTIYSARLMASLDFGMAVPIPRAPAGTAPAPGSILHARLVTALDSATTPRGTRVEAVLTQPLFAGVASSDQQLILPEGTTLVGEVTFTRQARHFHRHGELRFLFESVQAPDRTTAALLASLHAVEANEAGRLVVDDEGGTTSSSSKARMAAPALAALALVGTFHGHLDYDTDGAGPEMAYGGAVSGSLGGFLGMSVLGVGLSALSRPATIAIGVIGMTRTTYGAVFGKGREIVFPADTVIQVQLAPGPTAAPARP
jgi:hypothetical protein